MAGLKLKTDMNFRRIPGMKGFSVAQQLPY